VRLKLPDENTDFHLAGFSRSGNTFAASLIKNLLIKNYKLNFNFASHLHSTAVLKKCEALNLLQINLIRKPIDPIASGYLKYYALRNEEPPQVLDTILLKYLVMQYDAYYKYALSHSSNYRFVLFEDLIQYNLGFAKFITDILGYADVREKLKQVDIDKFNLFFKEHEKKKNPLGGSLPNKLKNERKKKVQKVLETLTKFKQSQIIYNEIVKLRIHLEEYENH